MIICGGRIDGATTAAQASCDSCATPSCMGATEPPGWGDFRSPIKCPELGRLPNLTTVGFHLKTASGT